MKDHKDIFFFFLSYIQHWKRGGLRKKKTNNAPLSLTLKKKKSNKLIDVSLNITVDIFKKENYQLKHPSPKRPEQVSKHIARQWLLNKLT